MNYFFNLIFSPKGTISRGEYAKSQMVIIIAIIAYSIFFNMLIKIKYETSSYLMNLTLACFGNLIYQYFVTVTDIKRLRELSQGLGIRIIYIIWFLFKIIVNCIMVFITVSIYYDNFPEFNYKHLSNLLFVPYILIALFWKIIFLFISKK